MNMKAEKNANSRRDFIKNKFGHGIAYIGRTGIFPRILCPDYRIQ